MQAVSPELVDARKIGLGCFEVGGRSYALDVSQLREVLRWQTVTPLPGAPGLIEGVIDMRGAIVPVLDLGRVLDAEPIRAGAGARIVVAELDGLVVGLAVEAAVGVIGVPVEALGDPPALATQAGYALARAVVRRPQAEPIVVLALEQILERVYRSSLAKPEEAS